MRANAPRVSTARRSARARAQLRRAPSRSRRRARPRECTLADTYSALKRTYTRLVGAVGLPANVLLGYLADWSHLLVTMPAEQVAVRMQTTGAAALCALREIRDERGGLGGFYSGIAAYVVLALKPAIQNAIFEALRKRVLERSARALGVAARELSAAQAFALGAIARAVATLLVFPCVRAKVLLMTRATTSPSAAAGAAAAGEAESARANARGSVREVLRQVVREEGVLALYQGIRPELVKGVLSAAVLLMAKEKIAASNRRLFHAAFGRRCDASPQ